MADLFYIRRRRAGGTTTFPRDYNVIAAAPITPRLAPNASPIGQAVALVQIADAGTGAVLGEVTPEIRNCSSMLSNYGDCTMTFSANAPAVTSGMVAPGRRVLIQFDNGLPAWGGVLDVPIDRDGMTVTLSAYEAPYLFKHRLTGQNVIGLTQADQLATEMVAAANAGIELHLLDAIPNLIEADYHYTPIWDVMTDIAQYGEYVSAARLGQSVQFDLYLGPRVGRDKSDSVWLIQGVNCQRPQIVEQGPIVNEVVVAADEGGWDADEEGARAVLAANDLGSAYRFGLRQELLLIDADEGVTLEDAAAAHLEEYAQPYQALTVDVLNLPPAMFGQYDVGDTVSVLLLEEYGRLATETRRRVVGREFYPATGVCRVILK